MYSFHTQTLDTFLYFAHFHDDANDVCVHTVASTEACQRQKHAHFRFATIILAARILLQLS